jgi:L-lysine 2,3-aminomutase
LTTLYRGISEPSRREPPRYRPILRRHIDQIRQLRDLPPGERLALKAVSAVLPFRVNGYVLRNLIDWDRIPEDPIYQLTFPQREMLEPEEFERMAGLVRRGAENPELTAAAREIQMKMNPHPAGQMDLNVPTVNGQPLPGLQHKYRETVLYFPSQGQTCHAYCTYCFRWPQFVGIEELKFAARESHLLRHYIAQRREVTDVLFTGGDPMVMRTNKLQAYIEPLLEDGMEHVTSIRLGTKALAYWPYRFTTDKDADDFLRLVERVRKAGKQLALMAHVSHPRELEPKPAQEAIRRLRSAGCVIRSQAPIIRRVNDDPAVWADMWSLQLRLGIVPYYMFVERETGPKDYFQVPLGLAFEVFRAAFQGVGGLGRTVRGPSMSATPGKVVVEGITRIRGEEVFVLSFLQGRDPEWVRQPFFARYDPDACWLDDLKPALGEDRFFFEERMEEIRSNPSMLPWDSSTETN